jgi:hypothetical protein
MQKDEKRCLHIKSPSLQGAINQGVLPRHIRKKTMIALTPASKSLFISFAEDAADWGGEPLLNITAAQRGNLTDLKKHGLLTTFRDEGCDWVIFTDAGREFAAANGIEYFQR